MGLLGPNPDKINPATGRLHREDARLYALRDREVARMEREHKQTRQRVQRAQSRRNAALN
jgi:hypothetical protein